MQPTYSYKGVGRLHKGTVEAMLELSKKDPTFPPDLVAGLQERAAELDFQERQATLFEPELNLEFTQ